MKPTLTILSTLLAASVAFAAPTRHSNIVKYKDSSLPHATGRSGNATIDALALFGKDGLTDVTVASNGTLDKVQLNADGGNAMNFNNLNTASFAQTLPDLAPHQALHVQANVAGVDGSRTDVVSADEIVKYRPDLRVSGISAPAHAMPGVPFVVTATISELNGDLGARADCVLSADGVELDRAHGIWVDAHDSVGCTFTGVLNSMGSHTLTVTASDVAPADWDDANNSASTSITISEPFDHYHATALDSDEHQTVHMDGPGPNTHSDSVSDTRHQAYTLDGSRLTAMNLDALTMHIVESSDGVPITEKWSNQMALHSTSSGDNYRCTTGWDDYTGYTACVTKSAVDGSSSLTFSIARSSFVVNYLGHTWNTQTGATSDEYLHSTEGPVTARYGSSVSLALTLTDGNTTIEALPEIAMSAFSDKHGGPHSLCRGTSQGPLCIHWSTLETGVRGSVDANSAY